MYNTIDKQYKEFIKILKYNKDLMTILDYIEKLKLPNFYIASGAVFQTIWNYLDNRSINYGIKDIDIVYYDSNNLSKEYEEKLESKIEKYFKDNNINYKFDIHNEARMHLWKKENENKDVDQYKNSEDAIIQWIATVQAIGITKNNNEIKVYAPFGLSDIYGKVIRPIKHKGNSKELYKKKVGSWSKRFDNLIIVDW